MEYKGFRVGALPRSDLRAGGAGSRVRCSSHGHLRVDLEGTVLPIPQGWIYSCPPHDCLGGSNNHADPVSDRDELHGPCRAPRSAFEPKTRPTSRGRLGHEFLYAFAEALFGAWAPEEVRKGWLLDNPRIPYEATSLKEGETTFDYTRETLQTFLERTGWTEVVQRMKCFLVLAVPSLSDDTAAF